MLKLVLLFFVLLSVAFSDSCVKNFTDAQRSEFVRAHNYYRQLIASGNQSGFPAASNMNQVSWDKEVETLAQNWASTNPNGHNPTRKLPTRPTAYVGENIYWSWRSQSTPITPGTANVTAAVVSWFDEFKYWSGDVGSFKNPTSGQVVGHFTQLIWADTSSIGCGISDCVTKSGSMYSQKVAIVCDYYTGGNILSQPIYKKGTKCSACAKGCSKVFPALCA